MSGPESFFAIMSIVECAQTVLGYLHRCDLKNLRLTCGVMDELVASENCNLFSRVYVSPFPEDRRVLELMMQDSRLVNCVTELVWDISSPRLPVNQPPPFVEYYLLLTSFRKFPRLMDIVLAGLVSDSLRERPKYFSPPHGKDYGGAGHVSFASPTTRILWRTAQDGTRICLRHVRRALTPEASKALEIEKRTKIALWSEHSRQEMDHLRKLAQHADRELITLSIVLKRLHVDLRSFSMLIPFPDHYRIPGFSRLMSPRSPLLDHGWSKLIQSLRRLCLWIYPGKYMHGEKLADILQHAKKLEHLHVAIDGCDEGIPDSMDWLLTGGIRLKHLVLQGFTIKEAFLVKHLLPCCFSRSIQTLHLMNCKFDIPSRGGSVFFSLSQDWTLAHSAERCGVMVHSISANYRTWPETILSSVP